MIAPLPCRSMITADSLVHLLDLAPHPEGGHYREVYRSSLAVQVPGRSVQRDALTAIHFLLRSGEASRWHRVSSDEVWHHSTGEPVELLLLDPGLEQARRVVLGPMDLGHAPFHVVPAGWWQAARPLGSFGLCTCLVAPGFDFADFTFMTDPAQQQHLRARWPHWAELL